MVSLSPESIDHSYLQRTLSLKKLLKIKIKAQWGSSWEVGISKKPRFYFMEKSGWEKFVRDNALGNSEFITFTHKGKMRFTVNIFKQDGKEMIHPPQSAAFLASSSRIKIEQREDVKKEEVVVTSEFSDRGPTTAAESNGPGTNRRKFNLGKKKEQTEESSTLGRKLRKRKIPRGLRKWL